MLNPFLHSEIDFEQQKIMIHVNLYSRIPAKKNYFITARQRIRQLIFYFLFFIIQNQFLNVKIDYHSKKNS
jgi:hypothetical protein